MAASNITCRFMLVFIVDDFLQHAVRGKKKKKQYLIQKYLVTFTSAGVLLINVIYTETFK